MPRKRREQEENPSDVKYGLLIDINGTPFPVEIRPFFHANEQPGIFVAFEFVAGECE